ncbi:MAG: hypothetical protein ABWW63_05415 [Glaciecola sp.]|jgi:hypothetical protein
MVLSINRVIVSSVIVLFFCGSSYAWQTVPVPKKPADTYYSDCSVVNITKQDERLLTREEKIMRRNQSLYDAIDNNAQCMGDAFGTSREQQNAAGGADSLKGQNGSNITNGGKAGNTAEQGLGQVASTDPVRQQSTRPEQAGPGAENQVVTGSNAGPCALYKELLAEATTPEETEFYQKELKKYGCK